MGQGLFCLPVSKNGEGILNDTPDNHLTCYEYLLPGPLPNPERWEFTNQFNESAPDQFDAGFASELCVPTTKLSVGTTTSTTTTVPTTTTTAAPTTTTTTVPLEKKLTLCHQAGAGSPKTLVVGANAVAAHLAHGDALGACP